MCFSPTASFGAATFLGLTAVFSIQKTQQSDEKGFFPLALIPLFFAFQQFLEGLTWLALQNRLSINFLTLEILAYLYLFFAYAFWPFWTPFSLMIFDRTKRIFFSGITVVGLIFMISTIIFFVHNPTIADPIIYESSICYLQGCHLNFSWITLVYLLLTAGSLLFATWPLLKILGLLVLCSSMLAYLFYIQTFASVWCFFAAILSVYIGFLAYKLEKNTA